MQSTKAVPMHRTFFSRLTALSVFLAGALGVSAALAQAPGSSGSIQIAQNARGDDYLPPWQRGQGGQGSQDDPGAPQPIAPRRNDGPPPPAPAPSSSYPASTATTRDYAAPPRDYAPPPRDYAPPPSQDYAPPPYDDGSYSSDEIIGAGHRFFGGVSKGLASVVEHAFEKQGRPNGYILGEEAGGAFVAGLRYGEGTLHTKNAGTHRIYWQGPSFGYDFGAEGSKTLILVYNLRDVDQLYNRFAGVDGSAYLVGGVGVTFQTYDDVVLAPIRSGVGLRLGANVGYLKYTRTPTWNPF
jgi:hypothetical protein